MKKEKLLQVFQLPHFSKSVLVFGAFNSKKEFWDLYVKECDIESTKGMDAEEREDITDKKNGLSDETDGGKRTTEVSQIALLNPGILLFINSEILSEGYWIKKIENAYFGQKFVSKDTLEELDRTEEIREEAKKYRKLKERLIKLGNYMQKDYVDAMV